MSVVFALIALTLVTAVIVVLLKPPRHSDPIEPSPAPPNVASRLPAPFTAEDLDRVTLPLAVRGYRMADVDALLERIRHEWRPIGVEDPPQGHPPLSSEPISSIPNGRPDGQPVLPAEQPIGPPVVPPTGSSPPGQHRGISESTPPQPPTERAP